MYRKLVPLIATTAAVVAPVSIAHAAVGIALQKPGTCFIDQGKKAGTVPIAFTVTGLAPGQSGNVTLSGQGVTGTPVQVAAPADGSGTTQAALTWTSALGAEPLGDIPVTLTVTDPTGAVLATTPATVGVAGLKIGDETAKKKLPKSVQWQVSGLNTVTGNATYYAHFIKLAEAKKKKPKVYATMKLGTGTGACGYLKSKRPPAPFKTKGAFVIAVQTTKTFDPTGPTLVGALKQ